MKAHPPILMLNGLILAGLVLVSTAEASDQELVLQSEGSRVRFILQASDRQVPGEMELAEGRIRIDAETGLASGRVVIDARSARTGSLRRDKKLHRRVLGSERHPEIVFRPERVTPGHVPRGKAMLEMAGTVDVHGGSQVVSLPIQVERDGRLVTARGELIVPGVSWGMSRPGFRALRVVPEVRVVLEVVGELAPRPNEVVMMGMIHSGHRTSEEYSLERVTEIVRAVDPDYILCEIPPGRLERALREYDETGEITEPRVRVFPEYVDAIIPLARQMNIELVPCAAWTKEMADDRRAKLRRYRTERPADYEVMRSAQAEASRLQEAEGLADDPRGVHSPRYHELVRRGMEPYDRLFNDDLGPGGWTNINRAHYDLIEDALEARAHEGSRVLITFGAWHAYWFLDELAQRDDIRLRSLVDFLGEGSD